MNQAPLVQAMIDRRDPKSAEEILPLIYDELRRLATGMLAYEKPGQTLQPTALVHEAYLRLVGDAPETPWDGRRHFYAAAAQAMRRILIDRARHHRSLKQGGDRRRVRVDLDTLLVEPPGEELLALDDALEALAREDPAGADLVRLRIFAGLTLAETAEVLGIGRRTADSYWAYARAWLCDVLVEDE